MGNLNSTEKEKCSFSFNKYRYRNSFWYNTALYMRTRKSSFNPSVLTDTRFGKVNPYLTLPPRLEEIPKNLNPFTDNGIRILMAIPQPLDAPLNTIKAFPVFYMLHEAYEKGELNDKRIIVEGSSGNTGKALGVLAPFFGIKETIIYVHESTSPEKIRLMEALGVTVRPVKDSVAVAKSEGTKPGYINLGQYDNPNNWVAYEPIGRMIGELTQGVDLLVASIGTGGTIIGISRSIREADHSMHVETVGVIPDVGESIPGIRDINRLQEVRLPWDDAVSTQNRGKLRTVTRQSAYLKSYALWKEYNLPAGPSSGAQLAAIYEELQERIESKTLDDLRREKDKEIVVVFIASDSYEPYEQDYKEFVV